jgi:formate-dependent nitrite reductase membrane component NrfD
MPTYDIFHLPALNWITVLYFFFGGLAAGSFLLSFWAGYMRENLKPLAKVSAMVTPISLAIGLLLLVLHLERPFQFWRILITFEPTSATSWGAWVLNFFFIVSILYAFLWFRNKPDRAKMLGWLGLPLAIFTGMYTGILMMQMSANPLWESALLPWMFLISGLLGATAVSILVMTVIRQEPSESFFGLKKCICTLIIAELLLVSTECLALYLGHVEDVQMANMLLMGEFSLLFVGLQIIVGSLLPLGLIVMVKASNSTAFRTLVSLLLVVGVFTMRCVVVLAGEGSL